MPQQLETVTTETTFLLPAPAGELELLLSPAPEEKNTKTHIAVICHPHPLHGGTMHNKVVTTLSKTFQQLNMQTIRFNFRGVGKSTGAYGEGIGEQEDLLTVIEWVKQQSPSANIWLAGFSFGAYISIRMAAEHTFAGLVSIAPPVNRFPQMALPDISCPWVIVQGDQDEIVPIEAVSTWVEKLPKAPVFISFPETGHFFHGKLSELKSSLIAELKKFAS